MTEKLIFELSSPGRSASAQYPGDDVETSIPPALRRTEPPLLPEVSELQAVRHFWSAMSLPACRWPGGTRTIRLSVTLCSCAPPR
jgi:hypothetical protein